MKRLLCMLRAADPSAAVRRIHKPSDFGLRAPVSDVPKYTARIAEVQYTQPPQITHQCQPLDPVRAVVVGNLRLITI